MLDQDGQKRLVGRWAADQVQDGMIVGLGTGSTAVWAVRALAERVQAGLRCTGVCTSLATEALASSLGIPVASLDDQAALDLAIDGADEVDPALDLIKGLGGALLREKLVELAAARFLVIVDAGKLVERLGVKVPLPVEVVPFGWRRTQEALRALGCTPALRQAGGQPFLTDSRHYIVDCRFDGIADAAALSQRIKALPGVIEHGLFVGMATHVAIGQADGTVAVRQRG